VTPDHDQFPPIQTGDRLLAVLNALANPHRLRIIAVLGRGRQYVSQLAREIGMSRPLLHMHLRKLEAAGLISGSMEISDDGKAMKFYEVTDFALALTPELISRLSETLPGEGTAGQEDA
jgi:predicted transcriptional regulator